MKKNNRYQITNKRRFASFLIGISILLISIAIIFTKNKVYSSTYAYNSRFLENHTEITVKEGDTLWNIAINYIPEKYDIRKMVFEIMELNNMENACIYPGDSIKIPIKHNPK